MAAITRPICRANAVSVGRLHRVCRANRRTELADRVNRERLPAEQARSLMDDLETSLAAAAATEADRPQPAAPAAVAGRLAAADLLRLTAPDASWRTEARTVARRRPERGDAAEYLDALLEAMVTVATEGVVSAPPLPGGRFPWRPAGTADAPVIELFTEPEAFAAAYPHLPSVRLRLLSLLWAWPAGHAMSVNPAGPAGLGLSAPEVPLLRQWVHTSLPAEVAGQVPPAVLDGMRWVREREWPAV